MSASAAEVYHVSHRGLKLAGAPGDLEEKGLIEREGDQFIALVPPRDARSKSNRHKHWEDEDILDRVRLWALIVGKPPTLYAWSPYRTKQIIETQIGKLRTRVSAHTELKALWEAGDWPSTSLVIDRFGSVNAALVMAGFEPRNPGEHHADLQPVHREKKTFVEYVADVDQAREEGGGEPLRKALYQLAVASLTEADRMSAKSERLDGPKFVEWLEAHGLENDSMFGSSVSRSLRRWRDGEEPGVGSADDILVKLGHHLHELPSGLWR